LVGRERRGEERRGEERRGEEGGDGGGIILDWLQQLWRNLELKLGSEAFGSAAVIFLGDYNDRGPDTKGVLDFLVGLPWRYPQQCHVFLCGNHDFAFAAFLGVLPAPHINYPRTWHEF
jgi:hypothetical protein